MFLSDVLRFKDKLNARANNQPNAKAESLSRCRLDFQFNHIDLVA